VFGHLSLHLLSAHALLGRLVGITLAGAAVRVGLLALLVPGYGLAGAAIGVAAAVVLEQGLMVGSALRRFGVGAGAMMRLVWRPLLGAAAMAAVLVETGLGWSDDPGVSGLLAAVVGGGAVYGLVVLASWLLAGRPAGPETDLLTLLRRGVRTA